LRAALLVVALIGASIAGPAGAFEAGLSSDGPDSTCIAGPGQFQQSAWVWTSGGLVYATLRIDFPDNLERRNPPVFDGRVIGFTRTDYPDGSEEWHMVLAGCPAGWIRLFNQSVSLLDDRPSTVVIRGADSWIRDCAFVLHRPDVIGGLALNEPGCASVVAGPGSWSALKSRYD